MKNFWRVPIQSKQDIELMFTQSNLIAPAELFLKLKPKHGIVLSEWDDLRQEGLVLAFGIAKSVDIINSTAEIIWQSADVRLKPNPSGRQFWRIKPFFKFANDVSVRYMLDDLFSEHFPDMEKMEFGEVRGIAHPVANKTYQQIPGYVYLIESQYGYKIGKTVNIQSRINLFSVKLPFPIKLINYAWFDNYSAAEREFHELFSEKRLEGEWFDLSEDDIEIIKSKGKSVPVKNL